MARLATQNQEKLLWIVILSGLQLLCEGAGEHSRHHGNTLTFHSVSFVILLTGRSTGWGRYGVLHSLFKGHKRYPSSFSSYKAPTEKRCILYWKQSLFWFFFHMEHPFHAFFHRNSTASGIARHIWGLFLQTLKYWKERLAATCQ